MPVSNKQWIHIRYHNGTKVKERYDRFVLTRNNSLLVMNARHEDSGVWELRDGDDNSCVVKYQAKLSGKRV